jgi:3-methyladenine DNA glycosylase AlkD
MVAVALRLPRQCSLVLVKRWVGEKVKRWEVEEVDWWDTVDGLAPEIQ